MNINNNKYILVDSRYRQNNENSNSFRYYFKENIFIKKLTLNYLFMARSNYLINSKNNKFKINFIDTNQSMIILLNEQNYKPLELVNYINLQLNNIYNTNFTYNAQTYKITITS